MIRVSSPEIAFAKFRPRARFGGSAQAQQIGQGVPRRACAIQLIARN